MAVRRFHENLVLRWQVRWNWRRKLLEALVVRHRQAGAIQPVEVRRR